MSDSLSELLGSFDPATEGSRMLDLIERLLPMPRSITGDGFRDTQEVLRETLPNLELRSVASGSPAFDWTIPDEWNIRAAHIKDPDGNIVVDYSDNPLHVMNYSIPVHVKLSLEQLKEHLHTEPSQPEAIPYRTSYYEDAWGFCMAHSVLAGLPEGEYEVLIDSTKAPGVLNYGELVHEGASQEEILLTAHACHPGQCNDNLSGVAVLTRAAALICSVETRRSFRFLFLPGSIGSVAWLSENRERAQRVVGGLTLSCLGDAAPLRYKETYSGDTVVDRAAGLLLRDAGWPSLRVPYEPYGFDERNFNSPGFRLAVGSLTRSPHGGFPGYHTSEDDMRTMSAPHLGESLAAVLSFARILDANGRYLNLVPQTEPQLGKRGLYPSVGGVKERRDMELALLWVMTMSDGGNSLVDVAVRSELPFTLIESAAELLVRHDLLREV